MDLILGGPLNVCTDVALRLRSCSIGKHLHRFIFARRRLCACLMQSPIRSHQKLISLAWHKYVCAGLYSLHGHQSLSHILKKLILRASYPQENTFRQTSLKHKKYSYSHETRGLHALLRELSKTTSYSTFGYSLPSIYFSGITGSPQNKNTVGKKK
jgi:hypothetical protein